MYRGIVRVLLVLLLGATVLVSLSIAFFFSRNAPPVGGNLQILFICTIFFAAPLVAMGSLLLGILTLVGQGKLRGVDRAASWIVALLGLLPVGFLILVFILRNGGLPP
jgi:hypothetical protein